MLLNVWLLKRRRWLSIVLSIIIFALIFKKIAIYTLIKENLSGKELPIVNKGLDGSRWTFQPQKWIYVKLSKAVLWSAYVI